MTTRSYTTIRDTTHQSKVWTANRTRDGNPKPLFDHRQQGLSTDLLN
jgi:hypothetical protein